MTRRAVIVSLLAVALLARPGLANAAADLSDCIDIAFVGSLAGQEDLGSVSDDKDPIGHSAFAYRFQIEEWLLGQPERSPVLLHGVAHAELNPEVRFWLAMAVRDDSGRYFIRNLENYIVRDTNGAFVHLVEDWDGEPILRDWLPSGYEDHVHSLHYRDRHGRLVAGRGIDVRALAEGLVSSLCTAPTPRE